MPNLHDLPNFIWQIADLLRGPYRPPQYERVMLPMRVLRRSDRVLAPTKEAVLAEYGRRAAPIATAVTGRTGVPQAAGPCRKGVTPC
jgi:type I restriction-modification system DNA methylase subunit